MASKIPNTRGEGDPYERGDESDEEADSSYPGTNQQVRARPVTIPRTPRIRRRCSTSTTSRIVPASRRTERRRRNPPGPRSTLFQPNRRSEGAATLVSFIPGKTSELNSTPSIPTPPT